MNLDLKTLANKNASILIVEIFKILSNDSGLKSKIPAPSGNKLSRNEIWTVNLNQNPNHNKSAKKVSKLIEFLPNDTIKL